MRGQYIHPPAVFYIECLSPTKMKLRLLQFLILVLLPIKITSSQIKDPFETCDPFICGNPYLLDSKTIFQQKDLLKRCRISTCKVYKYSYNSYNQKFSNDGQLDFEIKYDTLGNQIQYTTYVSKDQVIERSDYKYNADGTISDHTRFYDSTTYRVHYVYNEKGKIIQREAYADGDLSSTDHFEYNPRADLVKISHKDEYGFDNVSYSYDNSGHLMKMIVPSEGCDPRWIVTYTYDKDFRLIESIDKHVNLGIVYGEYYIYDNKSRLVRKTDTHNEITTVSYDSLGNVVQISIFILPSGVPHGSTYSFMYDRNGLILEVTESDFPTDEPEERSSYVYERFN
jgi:YD repeat-containing protein